MKVLNVRLTEEEQRKFKQIIKTGGTPSAYVHQLLRQTGFQNQEFPKKLAGFLCNMQTELEFMKDEESKTAMRKELNDLCRFLKSCQESI